MKFQNLNNRLLSASLIFMAFLLFTQIGYSSDTARELSEKVRNKINGYYFGDDFQIKSTANGRVEINGEVKTLFDKLRIFDIIAQVPGVNEIVDNLIVDTSVLPDKLVEGNIISEIKVVQSILEPDRIQVHVDNGEVILTGEVSFYREKLLAETVASWQKGVTGISNEIQVLPSKKAVSDDNLRIILNEILTNQFPLDHEITFSVNDGIVTLNGKVPSLWDKKQIEKEFHRVMGIKGVINNLKVKEFES